jgi:hypothetical protein
LLRELELEQFLPRVNKAVVLMGICSHSSTEKKVKTNTVKVPRFDGTFRPFLIRTLTRMGQKTTKQLYQIAPNYTTLARDTKRDTNRPTQMAWQHQLRRDQAILLKRGVIKRNGGMWSIA